MAKKPYNSVFSNSLADFKQLAHLGEGAYSNVYKVLRLADREIYALKKVKMGSLSDKEKQNALNEVRLTASIHNENIIAYKEAFFDDNTRCLCIVIEYADSGDLFQQITKCQKGRTHMAEHDVWRYVFGMCHGLKALHDMKILHRDLKCANIFLHSVGGEIQAKLGDFNVSKVAKRGLCMTQTGTPYYASPEVWRDMPYDSKSDMWSLGCVVYEMVALRPPFRAEDMEGLYRKVLRGQYQRIPPHYSNDLSEVVGLLLQVNPRNRPSVDNLLQMPVMQRHASEIEPGGGSQSPTDLLSTIKLPKNAIDLSTCLPKPQYDIGFGPHDEGGGPPSQENTDLIGGTQRSHHALTGVPGRGQQLLMPTDEIARGGREASLENYQDSLDKYLDPPPPQEGTPYNHAPPSQDASPAAPSRQPHLPVVSDSLDAYLQQKSRLPPPPRQMPSSDEQQDPSSATAQLREAANPRAHRQQQSQPDYSMSRAAPQYNAYPSPPALVNPRYAPESGYEPRDEPRVRASPAPSQLAAAYAARGQQVQGTYGGGGGQQYRHRGTERRPMASYARQQYALGGAGASAAQQTPPRQQSGGGGGLRLPRIFTKGS
jgi:serine/threonine protein kinase